MKKTLAIIAEYNPFHNGHLYQIKKAKEITGAENVIVIMSGNFTQRGDTSLINKFEKTKIALQNEVNMVIELPVIYSISSAENFALGAIKIINQLKVDYLVFGIEEENIEKLEEISEILVNENQNFKIKLKENLKKGKSYPKSREEAILKVLSGENVKKIINKPNNILAIEYLKILEKIKCNIKPIGIKRNIVEHNSQKSKKNFASGTYIRKLFNENKFDEIKKLVPKKSYKILKEQYNQKTYVSSLEEFSDIIIYKIRTMTLKQLKNIPEILEGLENKLKKIAGESKTTTEIIEKVSNKRYTKTRISRILTYILLEITKEQMQKSKEIIPYIRVLGTNKVDLLKEIELKKIITSLKKYEKINKDENLKELLEIDKKATNIYTIKYKKTSKSNLDYTEKFIII